MPEVTESPTTESRKVDHIRINLEQNVNFPRLTTGLERYRFLHCALPELDLNELDTSVQILGKTLRVPLLISSMTGGAEMAKRINRNLAVIAQEFGMAMGLGSQRAAIEDPRLADTYRIRDIAPDILFFANVGAVQLNYGYNWEHCQRAVDMVEADALYLHFNVLQEAVQPEGDTNWAGLLNKVEEVCRKVSVPVVAKEVGWGFSAADARRLASAGVQGIDVAGAGGTSWSEVEYHRAPTAFHARVARSFADWGIPTAEAILQAKQGAPNLPVFASGGLRDGIDVAKSIALGADLAGMAGPFLKTANESIEEARNFAREVITQLRIAMLCTGSRDLAALRQATLLKD